MNPLITLTDEAITHVKDIVKKANHSSGFRVSIKRTGCSGYAYAHAIVDEAVPGDLHFMQDELAIYVDPSCANFIKGTVIDYVTDSKIGLKQKRLVFINPNEKNRCGCGESFSA